MAAGPLHKTLAPLRQAAASQFFADWPDHRLLERFLAERDQAAFAELVQRHRRLVWGLCRHLLGHEQDAEDAFQATFLVLALKGRSVHKRQALASWLHGVAYRCAMQIKRQEARRLRREQKAARNESYDPAGEATARELAALLEKEVQRLPDRHRAPFVLCCLEGKSQDDAARELGWTTGTVSGRLARARQELQRRLGRVGFSLPIALTAATLAETDVSAAVISATVQGGMAALSGVAVMTGAISPKVLALAKGVTQTMLLTKIKTATAVVLFAGFMAGVGLTAQQAAFKERADDPKQAAAQNPQEPAPPAKSPPRNDSLRYDGKPFEYWREFSTNELKAERRVDAIRAMGAFGTRGYADKAAEVILSVIREYQDTDVMWAPFRGATLTPDEQVVSEAYAALRKIGPATAPILLKNLGAKNLRTFAVLAFRRGNMPLPKSSLPVLAQLIAEDKDGIPGAVLEILSGGGKPPEEQWHAVAAFLKNKGAAEKVVKSLTRIVAENPREFTQIMWQDMWFPRDVAAYFLGLMGERAQKAGPALVKAALEGQSKWVLEAALRVKPDPDMVVGLALETLKKETHKEWKQRIAAVELLAGLGAPAKSAIPVLVAAFPNTISSPDSLIREPSDPVRLGLGILHAFKNTSPDKDQIVPALVKIIRDKSHDVRVQATAFDLLRKIEPNLESHVPAMAEYLERFSSRTLNPFLTRALLRQALATFQELGPKAEKAMPALLHTFNHVDGGTKLVVITTWTRMGSAAHDALPVLYQLLASTEKNANSEGTRKLREAASAAIKAIGG